MFERQPTTLSESAATIGSSANTEMRMWSRPVLIPSFSYTVQRSLAASTESFAAKNHQSCMPIQSGHTTSRWVLLRVRSGSSMLCNGEILTLLAVDFYGRSFTDAVKPIVNETANADTMAPDRGKQFPLGRRAPKWGKSGIAGPALPRASNTPHSTRLGSARAIDDCPRHQTRASKSRGACCARRVRITCRRAKKIGMRSMPYETRDLVPCPP